MFPEAPDLVALLLKIGEFIRDIGPFVLLGAAAAAAQRIILGASSRAWSGERLIAPIAAIPLGIFPVIASALRSWIISQTSVNQPSTSDQPAGSALSRTLGYLDSLMYPFLVSAILAAVIVVLTPTEPLWTLLSPPEPWRLIIAPLVAGVLKPRGGSELPLILAMITKGLDPAGAIAGIAGAGFRHARSVPLALLHIGFGIAAGALFWIIPL